MSLFPADPPELAGVAFDATRWPVAVRSVETDGPQFVTRHGEEVAVVIDIAEYRCLRGGGEDFTAFLRAAPDLNLEIGRSVAPARVVDLSCS